MPAITALQLNDGQAVPVQHSFAPVGVQGNTALYEDRSGGISVGFPRIKVTVTPPSKTSKLHKVRFQIFRPTLETLGNNANGVVPPQQEAYKCTADQMFFLDQRSVLGDRKDIFAYAGNLVSSAFAGSLIKDLESVY